MNIKKTSLLLLAILLCTARIEALFEKEGCNRDDHLKSDTHGDVTDKNTSEAQYHAGRAQHSGLTDSLDGITESIDSPTQNQNSPMDTSLRSSSNLSKNTYQGPAASARPTAASARPTASSARAAATASAAASWSTAPLDASSLQPHRGIDDFTAASADTTSNSPWSTTVSKPSDATRPSHTPTESSDSVNSPSTEMSSSDSSSLPRFLDQLQNEINEAYQSLGLVDRPDIKNSFQRILETYNETSEKDKPILLFYLEKAAPLLSEALILAKNEQTAYSNHAIEFYCKAANAYINAYKEDQSSEKQILNKSKKEAEAALLIARAFKANNQKPVPYFFAALNLIKLIKNENDPTQLELNSCIFNCDIEMGMEILLKETPNKALIAIFTAAKELFLQAKNAETKDAMEKLYDQGVDALDQAKRLTSEGTLMSSAINATDEVPQERRSPEPQKNKSQQRPTLNTSATGKVPQERREATISEPRENASQRDLGSALRECNINCTIN